MRKVYDQSSKYDVTLESVTDKNRIKLWVNEPYKNNLSINSVVEVSHPRVLLTKKVKIQLNCWNREIKIIGSISEEISEWAKT